MLPVAIVAKGRFVVGVRDHGVQIANVMESRVDTLTLERG